MVQPAPASHQITPNGASGDMKDAALALSHCRRQSELIGDSDRFGDRLTALSPPTCRQMIRLRVRWLFGCKPPVIRIFTEYTTGVIGPRPVGGGIFTSVDGTTGPHGGSAVTTNGHLHEQVLNSVAAGVN